jgi:hypothetical protein
LLHIEQGKPATAFCLRNPENQTTLVLSLGLRRLLDSLQDHRDMVMDRHCVQPASSWKDASRVILQSKALS